ncbi:hypothetical protein QBC37DRAFT_305998 [Rhypophila decipiens]|uniref:Uncharacterized protein n=1 Tax=Rhypophila decipiens TaxID=261697 RepID=A0AAN6YFK9_9PEZI|nr:hypothetical protein QBC37DRAFT_305998 [Rhypophila decipiens]
MLIIFNYLDVSPSCFAEIELNRRKLGKVRFRRFDSNSRILYIVIPTRTHEGLHLNLYMYINVLSGQLRLWDFDARLIPSGAMTCRLVGSNDAEGTGGECGEGDSTECLLKSGIKWPALVILAGDFETINELREDMRWWFRASDHAVKIAVLAKFDRQKEHILLENWEEVVAPPNAAALSQNGIPEPSLRQSIIITRDGGTTDPRSDRYQVTGGALVLDFELLVLRQPVPPEGDFIISTEDLQDYGLRVFTAANIGTF